MRRSIILLCAVLGCAPLGCSVEKPSAPRYELPIAIPVTNENVVMSKVVSDRSSYLSVGADRTVNIDISQDIRRFEVGDNLAIPFPGASVGADLGGLLPSQPGRWVVTQGVDLPSSIQVSSAEVFSGGVQVDLTSSMTADASVEMGLDDFSRGGQAVQTTVGLPAAAARRATIDLAGTTFRPPDPRKLRLTLAVSAALPPGTQPFQANLAAGRLLLSRATAVFDGVEVPIPATGTDVQFPSGQFEVALSAATVELRLTNGIGAASRADVTVTGRNAKGQVVPMPVSEGIPAGDAASPPTATLKFDQTNSKILDLLNLIPVRLDTQGRVVLSSGGQVATVARTDYMSIRALFRAPLTLRIGVSAIQTDPVNVGVDDEKARRRIQSNVQAGSIVLALTNHLPVAVGVRLYVGTDPRTLFHAPALVVPRDRQADVAAAPLDPATGLAREDARSQVTFDLTAAEIGVFGRFYPLYSGVSITFPGTGGQTVRVVSTDYVRVSAQATVRLLVDKNLMD